jgi:hypothetical protein
MSRVSRTAILSLHKGAAHYQRPAFLYHDDQRRQYQQWDHWHHWHHHQGKLLLPLYQLWGVFPWRWLIGCWCRTLCTGSSVDHACSGRCRTPCTGSSGARARIGRCRTLCSGSSSARARARIGRCRTLCTGSSGARATELVAAPPTQ